MDPKVMLWNSPPPPPRQPRPGELLFEFIRATDRAPMSCELRYHGDYGVEAQFYVRSEFIIGRRFDLRAQAVQWADERDLESVGFDDDRQRQG